MKKLKIIYEDKYLIVVSKPANMLTISTEKEKENTLFHEVSMYEKKKFKNNKVFIVHRLDKETSGLIIFAKSLKVKNILQEKWENVKRIYVALLDGKLEGKGKIESYLKETKTMLTYSTKNPKEGKYACTKYQVLESNNKYTLVEIEILTGRKNQIRVHMKDINHPIVGDKKYGSKNNQIKKLCLQATKLEFDHPITKEKILLELPIPNEYMKLLKQKSNIIEK